MDELETPATRQARQFARLRRLGDLTMALAEASGTAALAEIEQRTALAPTPTPAPRQTTHAQDFLKASAALRQIIALELRVEAGSTQRRSASRPTPPPDPRRPLLQQVLHDAVRNDPNRARRRREIDDNIEQEILADPNPAAAKLIGETLGIICDRLYIDIDLARVPDEFLDYDEPIKRPTHDKTRDRPD